MGNGESVRIGEISINNDGEKMEIIEYTNARKLRIKFESGNTKQVQYSNFKKGTIKDELTKTVYGVGYLGLGQYSRKNNLNIYRVWNHMLERCYDSNHTEKYPTYDGCTVCNEWHNFQNFAKWYKENYYQVDDTKMALDKDILYKGNKLYSPKTCIFVTQRINSLFIKSDSSRGDFPIGVRIKNTRYEARISTLEKQINLGHYATIKDAFRVYKMAKEKYIKDVADEYKDKIPKKLYDAMYKYEVEITD